jgi:hypothetical protein
LQFLRPAPERRRVGRRMPGERGRGRERGGDDRWPASRSAALRRRQERFRLDRGRVLRPVSPGQRGAGPGHSASDDRGQLRGRVPALAATELLSSDSCLPAALTSRLHRHAFRWRLSSSASNWHSWTVGREPRPQRCCGCDPRQRLKCGIREPACRVHHPSLPRTAVLARLGIHHIMPSRSSAASECSRT